MFFFRRKPDVPDFIRNYNETPQPHHAMYWRDVGYSVFDVETSGLNNKKDVLLAIGLVEIEDGRVHVARHWYTLVRPPEGLLVDERSIRIHGLMRAELAEAPHADEVLPQFLKRIAGRTLIVHVAQVDITFINAALYARWGVRLVNPVIDTARLAMAIHERSKSLGEVHNDTPLPAIQLRALATRFGLPSYGEHNALNDALTTSQLFLAQASRLEAHGRSTLRHLLRAGKP